ncbi:MAG: exosortase [Gemmatimonadaceae bacterium]|nr:exosortase [Gemmatimonadaceae bacterium]
MSSQLNAKQPPATARLKPVSLVVPARWPLLVTGGLLLILLAHTGTLLGFARLWWGYLDHGFALVALVAWVCWRDRELLLSAGEVWWPAAAGVGLSTVLWLLGATSEILQVEQLALLLVLLSWSLGVLGRGKSRRLLVLAGYLGLALPMWAAVTGVLQQLTVWANAVLLAVSGLDAKISGTFISLPAGNFEVAAGCAGLGFFMSGITVGVAYGELFPLTRRGRAIALALMVGLSVISNWIRVFLLILIGHLTKMQSPLMADHGWFGWVIFAGMVGLFVYLARFIEARHSMAPSPTSHEGLPGTQLVLQPVVVGSAHLRGLIALTALAVLGPSLLWCLQQAPRASSPKSIPDIAASSDWTLLSMSERRPLAYGDSVVGRPWAPQYSGADRHVVQLWSNGTDTVQVDRLIFSGRDSRHKLFASSNVMAGSRAVLLDRVVGLSEGQRVRTLRQAVVRVDSTSLRAILYWFRVGNSSVGVPMVGRLMQIPSALTRSAPSELVAASATCTGACEQPFSLLQTFVLPSQPSSR